MTRLILIRHGTSEANLSGIFASHSDVDLLEQGLMQARLTADYVAQNYKVDAVYASDLQRAYKTGKTVADLFSLSVTPDPRLREIFAGRWEGMKFDDILARHKKEYTVWLKDIGNCVCPDGESVKQLGERVMQAITEIAQMHDGKTVVIATHATPIRVLQCLLEKGSLDEMKNVPWVSNCSVTELHYDNGAWSFAKIGADAHLADLRSTFPSNV